MFFQGCHIQDQITSVIAVQIGEDDSVFTKISMKIPMVIIVLLKGLQANRDSSWYQKPVYICVDYKSLLLFRGQIRVRKIPENLVMRFVTAAVCSY